MLLFWPLNFSKGLHLIGSTEVVGGSRYGKENGAEFQHEMKKMVASHGLLRNDSHVLSAQSVQFLPYFTAFVHVKLGLRGISI